MIIIEFSVSNLAYRILITLFTEEWGTSLITDSFEASNTTPADDIEVQIMDLKECYKKKRGRRTVKGPVEDHLADSKVTVMIHASEEISNVRAFTQRCPDAARRTHDTIGRSLQTVLPSVPNSTLGLFPSYPKPLFQSEAKCEAIGTKIIFISKHLKLVFTRNFLHSAWF